MDLRWEILAPYARLFVTGTWMTVQLTVIALVFGLIAGLMIGLVTAQPQQGLKQLLRWLFKAYVGFFRGTPLFVQILLVHFAFMPVLINPSDGLLVSGEAARELRQEHGAFLSGVLALTLNAAAYISEIVRAGIQSIARGQVQAAQSLGMNDQQAMRLIILPQALRRMVPPLVNESITLLKDSSLVSVMGLWEIMFLAQSYGRSAYRYMEMLITAAVIYWILSFLLELIQARLEKVFHGGKTR